MFYGNVCSTHKIWYAVPLKVRTYLIYSLVSYSQTSSNIFALCYFWCKEPCLPPVVDHSLARAMGTMSLIWVGWAGLQIHWYQPGDPWMSRMGTVQLSSLCGQAQGKKPASSIMSNTILAAAVLWVQTWFPNCIVSLGAAEGEMWWDVISLKDRGMPSLLKHLHNRFPTPFSAKEACGACCLHPLGGAAPCLMSAACTYPSWKGGFQKITEKAEVDKDQSNIKRRTAFGQLDQSWILPEKKAGI